LAVQGDLFMLDLTLRTFVVLHVPHADEMVVGELHFLPSFIVKVLGEVLIQSLKRVLLMSEGGIHHVPFVKRFQLGEGFHFERALLKLGKPQFLDHATHFFEFGGLIVIVTILLVRAFIFFSFKVIGSNITLEFPDVDAILGASGVDDTVVSWLEEALLNGEGVADEGLEVLGVVLAGIGVPQLDELVVSSSEHVLAIAGHVERGDALSVNGGQLTQVLSFKLRQLVHASPQVFGDDSYLLGVRVELEGPDHCPNTDLVAEDNRVSLVDHKVVAVVSQNSKHGVSDPPVPFVVAVIIYNFVVLAFSLVHLAPDVHLFL